MKNTTQLTGLALALAALAVAPARNAASQTNPASADYVIVISPAT
jgi:hypothetical protein